MIFSQKQILRNKDPTSRLTLRGIYEKFVRTGSIANDRRGKSIRREGNVIRVQQAVLNNPRKSIARSLL